MNGLDKIIYSRKSGNEILNELEQEAYVRESVIEKHLVKRVQELGGEVRR